MFPIVPAHDVPLAEQARIANAAFADYVGGWTEMNSETLARFLCLQGTDMMHSRFVESAGQLAGFGYIGRTGNILRLGGMAIEPVARGTGAAADLMDHLLEEARARGDAAMMLEVIEQNPRAHRFYLRHGFRDEGRLVGWRRAATATGAADRSVEEVPILDALKIPAAIDYPAWPRQITRHAVASLVGARAYRRGDVSVVISNPATPPIRVHGFFSASSNWPEYQSALLATIGHFAEHEFFTPPVFPEEFGQEVFEPLGFRREPLSQFLMRCDLSVARPQINLAGPW